MDPKLYDVIIVGGGPSGLTAALYLARARYRVLVIEKEKFGGQITITSDVVNYPGVESGSGEEITAVMRKQAQRFGAEFLIAEVTETVLHLDEKRVMTSRGEYRAFGVIIATGAHPRTVGFDGEDQYKGRGIAYCATCDGEFFTGLDVFVVGGGFAAAEESVFLTKYARHVTVLVREEDFTCAKATAEEVKRHSDITVHYNTVVESVHGEGAVNRIRCRNTKTEEVWEHQGPNGESIGVFVFAGYVPASDLVRGQIDLDDSGYIVTDSNQRTTLPGVYAAGDICRKNLRQMVTATSDGAVAATELERYVSGMHKTTGRIPSPPVSDPPVATRSTEPKRPNDTEESDQGFFTDDIRLQLEGVFQKMERPVRLLVKLDQRPVSQELKVFVQDLCEMSEKITAKYVKADPQDDTAPSVSIGRQEGDDAGISFHGVPGGHEFNSFVVGLYNVAGPGQELDSDLLSKIHAIEKPMDLKILVSLSCTLCPEMVMAAQKIATENPLVRAEAYDINHFKQLREQYNASSVPCLIVNNDSVHFGKKNISQLTELLWKDGRAERESS